MKTYAIALRGNPVGGAEIEGTVLVRAFDMRHARAQLRLMVVVLGGVVCDEWRTGRVRVFSPHNVTATWVDEGLTLVVTVVTEERNRRVVAQVAGRAARLVAGGCRKATRTDVTVADRLVGPGVEYTYRFAVSCAECGLGRKVHRHTCSES